MDTCRWSPIATFVPWTTTLNMGSRVMEKTAKLLENRIDHNKDGILSRNEVAKFLHGKLWHPDEVLEQLHSGYNVAPTGHDPVEELRDYLTSAMMDFHDVDRNGVVTLSEAFQVTAEWLTVTQAAQPIREFHQVWASMEETGRIDCDLPDYIPTWVHDPDGMPVPPSVHAGCEQAVQLYRKLLIDLGIPTSDEADGSGVESRAHDDL